MSIWNIKVLRIKYICDRDTSGFMNLNTGAYQGTFRKINCNKKSSTSSYGYKLRLLDLYRHSKSLIKMKRIMMILKRLLSIFVYLESKCSKGNSSVSMGLRNSKLYDITRTAIYRNGQGHDYMVCGKGHVTYKKHKGRML